MISTDEQDRTMDRLMETRERLAVRWVGDVMHACTGSETIRIDRAGVAHDSQGRLV